MDENKKTTINLINKKCFQYAITVGLNYKEIGKRAERITKTKPLVNKYNWDGINYPSDKDKKFELKKIGKNVRKVM